ncbi:hypothetical protein ILUMI_17527 [Ignelater luminosus]|uniref:Uncharacterized protein n=1 Tax=Ignelater luminosus TaxID=2038154 RepID=A0A8K0G7F9_IGNLU|nr:hypothetical protein ILUMI_17527 [Ignelater luminosus]
MDSDEYAIDENKRKRNMKNESGIFSKSKEIQRSSAKSQQKQDDELDKLLEIIKNLTEEVQEIKNEPKEYIEEIKELKEENERMKKENVNAKKEIAELKNKLKSVNYIVERFKQEKKRNNVVISGITLNTTIPNE